MKHLSLLLVAAAMIMTSCYKDRITGEGPVVTETRTHNNYSGIDLRIAGDVYFKQDTVYKVVVEAQQNILDVLETSVSDNKLVIKFDNDVRVKDYEPVKITVSGPSVKELKISGSGNITTTGPINPTSMEMDIDGSGNIHMTELSTGLLDADISGSGNISVDAGTASEEKLRISGSGNISLGDVTAVKATSNTSGSGDIRVNAGQQLNVTISGSGNVYYKGNPVINTSISGSGKVLHY